MTEGEKGRGERVDGRFEGEREGGEHSGGGGKRGYVLRGEGKEGLTEPCMVIRGVKFGG